MDLWQYELNKLRQEAAEIRDAITRVRSRSPAARSDIKKGEDVAESTIYDTSDFSGEDSEVRLNAKDVCTKIDSILLLITQI